MVAALVKHYILSSNVITEPYQALVSATKHALEQANTCSTDSMIVSLLLSSVRESAYWSDVTRDLVSDLTHNTQETTILKWNTCKQMEQRSLS
jgi:hypothetical protein